MADLVARIAERLRERPLFFADIARDFEGVPWRDLLRAWGAVRTRFPLERDEEGHYRIPARPPRRIRPAAASPAPSAGQRGKARRRVSLSRRGSSGGKTPRQS